MSPKSTKYAIVFDGRNGSHLAITLPHMDVFSMCKLRDVLNAACSPVWDDVARWSTPDQPFFFVTDESGEECELG